MVKKWLFWIEISLVLFLVIILNIMNIYHQLLLMHVLGENTVSS